MQSMSVPPDVSPQDLAVVDEIYRTIRELPVEEHERVERALAYAALERSRSGGTGELATFLDSLIVTVQRHRAPEYGKALADAELDDWTDGGATAEDLIDAGRRRRVGRRRS